jgi:uncharacterized membrane protein
MASVKYRVDIDAPPEGVFDLIMRVEGFKNYSRLIRDIKELSPGRYLWQVEYLGATFEWESEVTVSERPRRFAWRSRSGIYNTGSYILEPTARGTSVAFEMEFRLRDHKSDILTRPVLSHVMSLVAKELLDNIKKELDARR